MQSIPTEIEDRTYRYTQVERHDAIAIYEQQHKENAKVRRYEVIRIRVQPERTWPDGHVTPEREAYPGSTTWGKDGFTCFTLAEAQALAAALLAAGAQAQPAERESMAS